jgi:hypothetical protein
MLLQLAEKGILKGCPVGSRREWRVPIGSQKFMLNVVSSWKLG